jgi:hypothetical protein
MDHGLFGRVFGSQQRRKQEVMFGRGTCSKILAAAPPKGALESATFQDKQSENYLGFVPFQRFPTETCKTVIFQPMRKLIHKGQIVCYYVQTVCQKTLVQSEHFVFNTKFSKLHRTFLFVTEVGQKS